MADINRKFWLTSLAAQQPPHNNGAVCLPYTCTLHTVWENYSRQSYYYMYKHKCSSSKTAALCNTVLIYRREHLAQHILRYLNSLNLSTHGRSDLHNVSHKTTTDLLHFRQRWLFVIVIARGQGFMAVNRPSPRAQPEDKVGLRSHKSMATRAVTIIYPTWLAASIHESRV